MQNNTDKLWRHYDRAFRKLTAQRPKIMMSHFLPLEFEMAERYKHDPCSNFFYFHGAKYLENLDDGSIWQAGHTHTAIKLSGSFMPQRFKSLVDKFGSDPEAMKQAGIIYASDQIIDLYANGITNVHVYSMNKPDVAEGILRNVSAILGKNFSA